MQMKIQDNLYDNLEQLCSFSAVINHYKKHKSASTPKVWRINF